MGRGRCTKRRGKGKKELRYIVYKFNFSIMNVIIMHGSYVLTKSNIKPLLHSKRNNKTKSRNNLQNGKNVASYSSDKTLILGP